MNGIGEKGAAKLIKSFGNLESIYENIDSDQITKAHRTKLMASTDDAFMSQRLAKIVTDVSLPIQESDLAFTYDKLESLEFVEFLERYELKSIKNKIFVKLNGLD